MTDKEKLDKVWDYVTKVRSKLLEDMDDTDFAWGKITAYEEIINFLDDID